MTLQLQKFECPSCGRQAKAHVYGCRCGYIESGPNAEQLKRLEERSRLFLAAAASIRLHWPELYDLPGCNCSDLTGLIAAWGVTKSMDQLDKLVGLIESKTVSLGDQYIRGRLTTILDGVAS